MNVLDAIRGRRSIRRFHSTPVPEETVRAILEVAARAASGTNSQPWHVTVVTGEARRRVCDAVTAAAKAGERTPEYEYAPTPWPDVYRARARKVGFDLYALYGVKREDMAGRAAAGLRNFTFFGAPVGLFFHMEKLLRYGSWLDAGMYLQNVMLAAREFGLETCPQEAWCFYGQALRRALPQIPGDHVILSGMSLGYEDKAAPENTLVTEREPLANYTTFLKD